MCCIVQVHDGWMQVSITGSRAVLLQLVTFPMYVLSEMTFYINSVTQNDPWQIARLATTKTNKTGKSVNECEETILL
jgi:hypothetical protein